MNDTLDGGAVADSLSGSGGDDTLRGSTDANTLRRGAGNDTFQVAGGELTGDAIDGGSDLRHEQAGVFLIQPNASQKPLEARNSTKPYPDHRQFSASNPEPPGPVRQPIHWSHCSAVFPVISLSR
jgi:hypothetical protein